MTATSASVRFAADGVVEVQSSLRLTGEHLHPLLHLRRSRADPGDRGRARQESRSPSRTRAR